MRHTCTVPITHHTLLLLLLLLGTKKLKQSRYGNWSWHPEWAAEVGATTAPPHEDGTTGLWSRRLSKALSLVNPTARNLTVNLPALATWQRYLVLLLLATTAVLP